MFKFFLAAIFSITAVVISLLCASDSPDREDVASESTLTSVKPTRIYAAGIVEGATPQVELRSESAGRVVQIFVKEGQQVEQGAPLFQLDYREEEAKLAKARAALDLSKGERQEAIRRWEAKNAELRGAQRELERTTRLFRAEAASAGDTDQRATQVDTLAAELAAAAAQIMPHSEGKSLADARIDAARANVQLAEVLLERTIVQAPLAGQVLDVNIEVGEMVSSETAEPSVVMVDNRQFHVRAFVEELDATKVEVGSRANISVVGMPDHDIRGEIIYVSPRMAPKKLWRNKSEELFDVKTREVVIQILDSVELVIGMDVDVMIERPEGARNAPAQQ